MGAPFLTGSIAPAAKGFSSGGRKAGTASKERKRRIDLKDELSGATKAKAMTSAVKKPVGEGWKQLATVKEVREKGGKKPFIVKGVEGGVLVIEAKEDGAEDSAWFACNVYSTAYKYPLMDGTVSRSESGKWTIETPLDGTKYDLRTGAVIEWCPQDTVGRKILGALKSSVQPSPLTTYPIAIEEDNIFVKY
ncbi:unnamed protein product [Pedinophyceae sp. YPF-701]|nr:unnamed protein product [Pedinophyceae sp. YPF-701]